MRSRGLFVTVCLAMLSIGGQAAQAQTQQATAVQPRIGQYNKSAETTVSGTVTAIESQSATTLPRGTYLTLRSGGSLLSVHMGLLSQKSLPFKSGAQVTVIGALAAVNGSKIFLAREVQSGGKTIVVRSPNGFVLRPHSISSSQGLQP
jgi:hypothetical protein